MLNTSFEPQVLGQSESVSHFKNVSHEWNQLLLPRECPY